jgi:Pyridoxamine 5'-phosphate oxidase
MSPTHAILPEWPPRTVALLSTSDDVGPHAIPVSAPVRAGDHAILINLRADRDSLSRLRARPRVALTILAEGDVAFTARGRAQALDEPLPGTTAYTAVAILVDEVDDHRQPAFTVTGGVDREWTDPDEQRALGERVGALRKLTPPVSI